MPPVAKDEVVAEAQIQILELVLAPQPTRQSEFLEVAFVQAVECRTMDLVRTIPWGRAEEGRRTLAEKEWLVTNGLGGYASGTLSGALTRRLATAHIYCDIASTARRMIC